MRKLHHLLFWDGLCLSAKRNRFGLAGMLAFLLAFYPLHENQAQSGLTLYHLTTVPQVQHLNPASIPASRVFVSLPGISHISFAGSANAFSIDDLNLSYRLFRGEADFDNADWKNDLFAAAGSMNKTRFQFETDLLGFGFQVKRHFFSFSISERIDAQMVFSSELPRFLRDEEAGFDNTGEVYELSDWKFSAMHYRPYTLNYAFAFNPNLTAGLSVSYISGIASVITENNGLKAVINDNAVGFGLQGSLQVNSAGIEPYLDGFDGNDYFLHPRNSGLAFGAGAKLAVLDQQLELSMSAINLGFISWKEKLNRSTLSNELVSSQKEFSQVIEHWIDGDPGSAEAFKSTLQPRFFLGGNYHLPGPHSIGLLLGAMPVQGAFNPNLTLTYNARVSDWFGVTTGYSMANGNHNFGLGFSINAGPIQWYLLSDNVPSLFTSSAQYTQVSTGINLTFGCMDRDKESLRFVFPEPPEPHSHMFPDTLSGDFIPILAEDARLHKAASDSVIVRRSQIEEEPEDDPRQGGKIIGKPKEEDAVGKQYFVALSTEMKAQPNGDSELVAFLPAGAEVTVVAQQSRYWWEVVCEDKQGWVIPATLLSADAVDPETARNIQANTVEPKPVKGLLRVKQATSLRTGPSASERVIRRLQESEEVFLLEKTDRYWWKVRFEDQVGYAKAALMIPLTGTIDSPVVETPAKEADWITASQEEPAPEIPQVDDLSKYPVYYVEKRTSLRFKPTSQSGVMLRLPDGGAVRVLEKTDQYWWMVAYDDAVGFAKAHLLQKEKP